MSFSWVQIESNSIAEGDRENFLNFLSTLGNETLGTSFTLDSDAEQVDGDGDNLSDNDFFRKGAEGKLYFTRDDSCHILGDVEIGALQDFRNKIDSSNQDFFSKNPVLLSETCSSSGFRGGELDNHLACAFLWKGFSYFDCSPSYGDYISEYNENPQEFKERYKVLPFFDELHVPSKTLKVELVPSRAFDDIDKAYAALYDVGFDSHTAKQISSVLCEKSWLDVNLSDGCAERMLSSRDKDEVLQIIKKLSIALQTARGSGSTPASVSLFLGLERNIVFHLSSDGSTPHAIIYDSGNTDRMLEHYKQHISKFL